MKTATTALQMIVRFCGVVLIVLGVLFWIGTATGLVPVHMLLGLVLVLALWGLAILAGVSGGSAGFVALGIVWGLIVLALGMTQASILPGPSHVVIQILHLLVGLGALGIAESLGRGIKRRLALQTRAA
ncbi:MAG TPA: hypothetical protein VFZ25_13720 [Chloroflexota bacterium]|nr:hypothetical protein [Chloroflexota bacterium]